MLYAAQLYEEDLNSLFIGIWFDEKYKYWNAGAHYDKFEVEDTTYNKHQFVSVNSKTDQVIGYIGYDVDRVSQVVSCFNIINFTDNKFIFGKDVMQAVDDIFRMFKFYKIEFNVVVGNPAEKIYDKFIKLYGGKVVGIFHSRIVLIDGKRYDMKYYELTRNNYLKHVDT